MILLQTFQDFWSVSSQFDRQFQAYVEFRFMSGKMFFKFQTTNSENSKSQFQCLKVIFCFFLFSCRLAGKLWSSLLLSLLLSVHNVYPLARYEREWHNSFAQSYMFDLVQTFSNLFCSIIHVQTCSNFFKLVQAYSNLSKLVQTCSNLC